MDYDENLHLAGEGSSKFPPVLQPYALPKFEFEDHLTFDNLVETEVFLGIESNTDNQWIEDFRRGSSGIEFDIIAGDSCSISRRNNVWSEATSSEFVEMLLKSVGQEEIIPEFTKEADACDELGCLKKQMESTFEHNESTHSVTGDAMYLQPTSILDAVPEKSDTNASKSGPSNSDLVSKVESAAEGNAVTPNTSYIEETSSMVVEIESDLHIMETCEDDVCSRLPAETDKYKNKDVLKCTEIDGQSVKYANRESLTDVKSDISFRGHVEDADNSDSVVCACPEPKMDLHVQIADGQSMVVDKKELLVGSQQSDAQMLDSKSVESVLVIEDSKVSKAEFDSSDIDVRNTYSLPMVDFSGKFLRETRITNTLHNMHGVGVSKGILNAERHVLSSNSVGSLQGCEENIGSRHSDIHNCNQNVSISDLEANFFSVDPSNNREVGISNPDDRAVESSSLGGSSTEFMWSKSSTNPSNYDCRIGGPDVIDKGVGSFPSGGVNTENDQTLLINSLVTSSWNQLESEVTFENANLALGDTVDGDVLHPGNDCTADEDRKAGENSLLPAMKLSHLDRKEQSASEMPKDACPLPIAACSQEESYLEFEKNAPSETRLLSEHGLSLSVVYTCNSDSQDGPQEAVSEKICREGSKGLNDCSVYDQITMEEGGGTDALALEKNDLATKKNNGKAPSKDSGDTVDTKADSSSLSQFSLSNSVETESNYPSPDKGTCSSVPLIKFTELSKGGSEKEMRMKAAADHNPPSEVPDGDEIKSRSASQNLGGTDASKDGKSPIVEVIAGASTTLSLGQVASKIGNNLLCGSQQVSDAAIGLKNIHGRKPRGASVKATGKETARKRKRVTEASPIKQSEKGHKASHVSLNPSGIIHPVQSSFTPALPDLNTSLSPTAIFQQPFSDLQQVQLRAQIFVYGSLIQAIAPDKAYMTSAFGGPDGDRSVWENVWHVSVEKSRSKKYSPVNPETHLRSHSAVRAPHPALKQNAFLNKVGSLPVGQTSNSGTPSTIVNPVMPLASPLWSITTPPYDALPSRNVPRGSAMDFQQLFSPLHLYQSPMRNIGYNSSCQGPIRSPGASSAQTSPGPVMHSGGPASALIDNTLTSDTRKATVSAGLTSTDRKSRKRKKNPNTEDSDKISLQSQSRKKPVSTPASHQFASIVSTFRSGSVFKSTSEDVVISPTPSTDQLKEPNSEQRAILSEEALSKVKEARKHAEDAAAVAATAVCHREEVRNQLNSQKNTGLITDVEAQLASATVAIAASVSVAKAAAAAAKVASSVALQAKLLANEALLSCAYGNCSQIEEISLSDSANILGKATPATILKGEDAILKGEDLTKSSSTIIAAAREASRKRVEAASAASKQAENLDALVKAAELAAEAVSRAGKIVSLGDPMPLNELVQHGPNNYWRVAQASLDLVTKSNDVKSSSPGETSKGLIMHDHERDGILGFMTATKKDSRGQKGPNVSYSTKPSKLGPQVESGYKLASVTVHNDYAEGVQTPKLISIKEGSHVEVYKDGDGLKAAWFSANVLSLKDGKAYVGYNKLLDEGSGPLKEWVALGGETDNTPGIRFARSKNNMQFKGTRKRHKTAMGDYIWSIGAKVDVYMHDSWREGFVTEKNNKDETMVTVHFPAQGETSVVRAWDLRPSLIWRDGDWVEWSGEGANSSASLEGDARHEKRLKLGSPVVIKGKNKMSKNIDDVELRKPEDIRLLDLDVNQKVFTIGRSRRDENKPDPLRMVRSGLQKEGSRVIFGVPKPGKKRKFMDVSKHYVADGKGKSNEANESVMFSKSFFPQGSGSHGSKHNNKSDLKGKRALESNATVPRSENVRSVSGRTISQKENFSTPTVSTNADGTVTDNVTQIKDSMIYNESEKQDQMEFGCFSSKGAPGGPISHSSFPRSSKKIPASNPKVDRANKGKLAAVGAKLSKIEEEKVLDGIPTTGAPAAVEPRRSIRKFQPTSKLLEGLQSSLIISKITSSSNDRTHKNENRDASKGNNKG